MKNNCTLCPYNCNVDRNEKLGYRLREAQTMKIPYTLILGDNEKDSKNISYRAFGSKDTKTISLDEFIKLIVDGQKDKEL